MAIYNSATCFALRNYAEAVIAKGEAGAGPARRTAKIVLRLCREEYKKAARHDATYGPHSEAYANAAKYLADEVERWP